MTNTNKSSSECSLDIMCMREPAWAASRIRALTDELSSSRESWHAEHRRAAERIERLELESLALKRRIAELARAYSETLATDVENETAA